MRHILKQRADINRVLNEIKESNELKDITSHQRIPAEPFKETNNRKKVINKINPDQDSYRINRDWKRQSVTALEVIIL